MNVQPEPILQTENIPVFPDDDIELLSQPSNIPDILYRHLSRPIFHSVHKVSGSATVTSIELSRLSIGTPYYFPSPETIPSGNYVPIHYLMPYFFRYCRPSYMLKLTAVSSHTVNHHLRIYYQRFAVPVKNEQRVPHVDWNLSESRSITVPLNPVHLSSFALTDVREYIAPATDVVTQFPLSHATQYEFGSVKIESMNTYQTSTGNSSYDIIVEVLPTHLFIEPYRNVRPETQTIYRV